MRAIGLILAILFVAPAAGALVTTPARIEVTPLAAAPLLPGPRDGDVIAMLAEVKGIRVTRLAPPTVPHDLTLPLMVERLALRVDQPLTPEDLAAFAALDPAIQAPVLTLLVAMEQAWDLRDAAFARHTPEALYEHHMAILAGDAPASIVTPDEQEMLVAAAIMLSDTLDTLVLPQLAALAQDPRWPATAIADPVGVLRIGGTGNDRETLDRFLEIDPRGNDVHVNNAGSTTVLNDMNPATPDWPVGILIDFAGNDYYRRNITRQAMGSAFAGIGFAFDLSGNDQYECIIACLGAGGDGIGLFRDAAGTDQYSSDGGEGFGFGGFFGIARDDAGDDTHFVGTAAGGAGHVDGLGLMWDRAGTDTYISGGCFCIWGDAREGGAGWFVDEGGEDAFVPYDALRQVPPWVCNACTWESGEDLLGRGNNDAGGLQHLVARQRSWPPGTH